MLFMFLRPKEYKRTHNRVLFLCKNLNLMKGMIKMYFEDEVYDPGMVTFEHNCENITWEYLQLYIDKYCKEIKGIEDYIDSLNFEYWKGEQMKDILVKEFCLQKILDDGVEGEALSY